MPSNTVTNANTTAFKGSDFTDSPGNRMGESTILDMDLMEEKSPKSSASCKAGKPGRKRKQFPVESCGSLENIVSVGPKYTVLGRSSVAQVLNGDMDEHRGRMLDACFPKQEKSEVENGIPRDPSSCRAEDSSPGQSPTQENGFLPSREEQDSEKDKDDSLMPPRKKRGRKLKRPTKYVEHKEEDGNDAVKTEGGRGRLRGGVGWEISLRQRPMPRITFQAGDPYYISKRTREEWLAKWKMEIVLGLV